MHRAPQGASSTRNRQSSAATGTGWGGLMWAQLLAPLFTTETRILDTFLAEEGLFWFTGHRGKEDVVTRVGAAGHMATSTVGEQRDGHWHLAGSLFLFSPDLRRGVMPPCLSFPSQATPGSQSPQRWMPFHAGWGRRARDLMALDRITLGTCCKVRLIYQPPLVDS